MAPPKALTLIVAATSSLGIGHSGSLPWPRLKHEIASFARITKTLGLSPSTSVHPTPHCRRRNAVIMGRKTWSSIPLRFRPLPDRLNIIISSTLSQSDLISQSSHHQNTDKDTLDSTTTAVILPTLPLVLTHLSSLNPDAIANTFIIGGASVYAAALALPQTDRVLFTKVAGEWECDTLFPLDLEGKEGRRLGWRLASEGERRGCVGEDGEGVVDEDGRVREGEVEYRFCMYVREGWRGE